MNGPVRTAVVLALALAPPAGADLPPSDPLIVCEWNSADLSSAAIVHLDAVVDQSILPRLRPSIHLPPIRRISLRGNADSSGPVRTNLDLSRRRAETVRDYLIRRGVPHALIHIRADGEARPLQPSRHGAREAQNRYVLIELDFASR